MSHKVVIDVVYEDIKYTLKMWSNSNVWFSFVVEVIKEIETRIDPKIDFRFNVFEFFSEWREHFMPTDPEDSLLTNLTLIQVSVKRCDPSIESDQIFVVPIVDRLNEFTDNETKPESAEDCPQRFDVLPKSLSHLKCSNRFLRAKLISYKVGSHKKKNNYSNNTATDVSIDTAVKQEKYSRRRSASRRISGFGVKPDSNVQTNEPFTLHPLLISGMSVSGETKLSALQKSAIIAIIKGKDTIIESEANKDQIVSYVIPVLQNISRWKKESQALILVSNEKRAQEVYKVVSELGRDMRIRYQLCTGQKKEEAVHLLPRGPHIVVGTPKQVLKMLVEKKVLGTLFISIVVIDGIDRIIVHRSKQLSDIMAKIKEKGLQTIVLTDNMDDKLQVLAENMTSNAVYIRIQNNKN